MQFVLNNYIAKGVGELDDGNISTMVTLKYGGTYEGMKVLGTNTAKIKNTFIEFQQYLYATQEVA